MPTTFPPLPEWVQSIRPHQQDAVDEAMELFQTNDVVFMDGPTGTGKTLIGELIRRRFSPSDKSMYVCSDKSLQRQFARDFDYAKVLMGRANYPTENGDSRYTAADCTAVGFEDPCWFCPSGKLGCPYEIAKREALSSPLAVTNTAYMLTESNYVGNFSGRDLIIADEGDTLEKMLMNFVEFRTPRRYLDMLRMDPPRKSARKTTICLWLDDYETELRKHASRESDPKRQRAMVSGADAAKRVRVELQRDIERRGADAEDSGTWLRDYDTRENVLILKPVTVNTHGSRYLWRHASKFLIMSATLISSEELATSLGLPLDYATVTVPMTFPVSNRPIILAPVANVVYKEMDRAIPKLVLAILRIAERHPGDRILVHTVSYDLTNKLVQGMKQGIGDVPGTERAVFSYTSASDRESALERYKESDGGILFAPSMERGVDLPGDLCRVQVIAKVPFPSFGDRQVSARTHLPGGQMWYTVQTIRDIVQMAGRGVRSEDDHATTYILDEQFGRNIWRKWKMMLPSWFRDAVDTKSDVRWMMK